MRHTWFPVIFVTATFLSAGCLQGVTETAESRPLFDSLLMGDAYVELRIRVHYVDGRDPSSQALADLVGVLEPVLHKRSIHVDLDTSPMKGLDSPYTVLDLRAMAEDHLETHPMAPCPTLSMDVFYVNGSPSTPENLAGFYSPPWIFIFKDRIHTFEGPGTGHGIPDPQALWVEKAERAVLVHEFGHAMGLVDLGVPMITPREHPEHPGHSENRASVMYPTIDTQAGLLEYALENEAVPYRFDPADLEDLRTYQEIRASKQLDCP